MGSLANTEKLKNDVQSDVDGYAKFTEKLNEQQCAENQKNTKTEISTKLVLVSTSRLPGWVPPFTPLVTHGLGARGVGAYCHCHVRCAQVSIPATSSERSDKKWTKRRSC